MTIVNNDLDTYGLRSFKITKSRSQPQPYVVEEALVGPPFVVAKTESIGELPVYWDVNFEAFSYSEAQLFEQFLDYLDSSDGKFFKTMSTEWGMKRHEMVIVGNRPQPQHRAPAMWIYSFRVYSTLLDRTILVETGNVIV